MEVIKKVDVLLSLHKTGLHSPLREHQREAHIHGKLGGAGRFQERGHSPRILSLSFLFYNTTFKEKIDLIFYSSPTGSSGRFSGSSSKGGATSAKGAFPARKLERMNLIS